VPAPAASCPIRPTAIRVGSDVMAIGAPQAAAWPPLRVPEDISIVGFDGISFSALVTPSLTTVAQPTYRPGRLGGVARSQAASRAPHRSGPPTFRADA